MAVAASEEAAVVAAVVDMVDKVDIPTGSAVRGIRYQEFGFPLIPPWRRLPKCEGNVFWHRGT